MTRSTQANDLLATEHSWSGFTLRELMVRAQPGAAFLGPYPERVRITLILDSVGGDAYCRDYAPAPAAQRARMARAICLKPAGLPSWFCSDTGGSFRAITLSFEDSVFKSGPLASSELPELTVPRMMFANDRLWRLGLDLANERRTPREFSPLYCDSLATMMLLELLRDSPARERIEPKGGLTRAQLARVLECIESSPSTRVRLSELAALTGLSMSHFSVAFKQSTGMPPHRWQLNSRVQRAKQLLLRRELHIVEIAQVTGFVDQSHFTRTFRHFVGVTPMAWRREMLGSDSVQAG